MRTGSYGKILGFAALLGCLVASNAPMFSTEVFGLYAYWIIRLMIEAGLLLAFGILFAALAPRLSFWQRTAVSILVSLLPFVLIVTAMDIVLGLPELQVGADKVAGPRIGAFGREMLYLLDNHIVLGVLLALASQALAARETTPPPEAVAGIPTPEATRD